MLKQCVIFCKHVPYNSLLVERRKVEIKLLINRFCYSHRIEFTGWDLPDDVVESERPE